MAYIITSKTRSKIMSQPKERAKMMGEIRAKSIDKHNVYSATPTDGRKEEDVHKEMDDNGSMVNEMMHARQEKTQEDFKKKEEKRKETRGKLVKEREDKLKKRDAELIEKARKQKKG